MRIAVDGKIVSTPTSVLVVTGYECRLMSIGDMKARMKARKKVDHLEYDISVATRGYSDSDDPDSDGAFAFERPKPEDMFDIRLKHINADGALFVGHDAYEWVLRYFDHSNTYCQTNGIESMEFDTASQFVKITFATLNI